MHRRGEAYGVAQVVHPVVGVAVGLLARVERGRRVVGDFRLQRADFGERFGQFVEDRVDLRGVRCYVDGHLTGQHVALLPGGHQVAYRLGGPADHGGLRGGHHRDHGVVDAARHQLRKHLLSRQFHRCHGAGAGDTGHQRRPPADDAHSVFEAERAGDHRGRGLAQRVADDRAGRYAVGLHCGRQRDLHGKQGRLHPVDAGHDLGAVMASVTEKPDSAAISGSIAAMVAANTGSVASRSAPMPAHCEPCPENTQTGPRSSWPTAGG